MPFQIKVDADKTLKQFDQLQNNIAELEQKLPEVFLAWQREDMNRKYPKVDGGGTSYSTLIYPRSRLKRTHTSKGGKQARRRARVAAGRPGAKRSILRPELFDQLKQRMVDMLKEAAKWQ